MHILGILLIHALAPLGLLYLPFYLRKLSKRGNWRRGFGERFGLISGEKRRQIRALRRPVWLHAVSVGETQAALTFIRKWREREPDRDFVLSTTTSTGQEIARQKATEGVVPIYFPVDFAWFDLLALWSVRPTLFITLEKEIWPTFLFLTNLMGIPSAMINGIVSERGHRRYVKQRWLFRPVFRYFHAICVQTRQDAERIRDIAGPDAPVHVCHSLKFDAAPAPEGYPAQAALLDRVFPADRLILCAASTHPGEEAVMLQAYQRLVADHPALRLVLVPRHWERTHEVEADIRAASLDYVLRSSLADDPEASHDCPVLVVNSTGELLGFLAAADIVFVGKSLAGQTGGHNIIEPAMFAKPTITGDHTENFPLVMDAFREAGAVIEVADVDSFTAACRNLLDDPAARADLGDKAKACADALRGAAERTLDQLAAIDTTR